MKTEVWAWAGSDLCERSLGGMSVNKTESVEGRQRGPHHDGAALADVGGQLLGQHGGAAAAAAGLRVPAGTQGEPEGRKGEGRGAFLPIPHPE